MNTNAIIIVTSVGVVWTNEGMRMGKGHQVQVVPKDVYQYD